MLFLSSKHSKIMKKIFFVFLCFLGYAIQAQTIIPKVGATYSTVAFEGDDDVEAKIGLSFGVGFNFLLTERISLQPELNFVQKGYSESSSFTQDFVYGGGSYTSTYNEDNLMNYLQLPVLVKVSFGKFYLNVGPSLGYGLKGKGSSNYKEVGIDAFGSTYEYNEEYKYDILFEKRPENYEGSDSYVDNRMNFSVQVGGGITLMDKLNIDVRYGQGFSTLFDDFKTKHRVFQVTLGVPIKL